MSEMTALESLFNGSLTGKRNQQIYTPAPYIRALHRLWTQGVGCDPCTGPETLLDAEVSFGPGQEQEDGLAVFWPDRSYCNPPYGNLKEWLAHAVECLVWDDSLEYVLLVPVRTHRKWFRAAMLQKFPVVCLHDPMVFHGWDKKGEPFKQTFPAPLCSLYAGNRPEAFKEAFSPLGSCVRVSPL